MILSRTDVQTKWAGMMNKKKTVIFLKKKKMFQKHNTVGIVPNS